MIEQNNLQEQDEEGESPTLKPTLPEQKEAPRIEKTVKATEKKREKPKEPPKDYEIDDFEKEKKVRALIQISPSMRDKIKKEAQEKDVSRAVVVRTALDYYFANKDNIIKENPDKTEDIKKIQNAINESTNWLGSFDYEIFLSKLQEKELIGDEVWTEPLLEAYLIPKIHEAIESLLGLDQEALADNCNLCVDKLQLSGDKAKFIASKFGLEYGEQEVKDKGFFEGLI